MTRPRKLGCPAVIILGDPHNYCKHGFRSSRDYNISDVQGRFPFGQLVLALDKDRLAGAAWKFRYSDVFLLNPDEAAAFDATFPKKEKAHRISQDLFSIAVRAYLD